MRQSEKLQVYDNPWDVVQFGPKRGKHPHVARLNGDKISAKSDVNCAQDAHFFGATSSCKVSKNLPHALNLSNIVGEHVN